MTATSCHCPRPGLNPHLTAKIPRIYAAANTEVSAVSPTALPPDLRGYKEALLTTRVLVEKLRVVRAFCSSRRTPCTRCTNCDDV